MKRAIEFEEVVSYKHRVIIETEDEGNIDDICNLSGSSFEDIVDQIYEIPGVILLDCSNEYSEDCDQEVAYWDDYWTKDEEELYGDL